MANNDETDEIFSAYCGDCDKILYEGRWNQATSVAYTHEAETGHDVDVESDHEAETDHDVDVESDTVD